MAELKAAPVLSTPAENLFDVAAPLPDDSVPRRSNDELRSVYEVERTAREIRAGGWTRVALQFPDDMLGESPRVVTLLREELAAQRAAAATAATAATTETTTATAETTPRPTEEEKLYILADTSYSACCVDEVAAEHAAADVVVHYGRACLSPTARLPVVYVFTQHALDVDAVVAAFVRQFGPAGGDGDGGAVRAVVMADVTYQDHVVPVATRLRRLGYRHVLATRVVRRPLGSIPNRKLVEVDGAGGDEGGGGGEGEGEGAVVADDDGTVDLHEYAVFHIAAPPTSLLLALATRVGSFYIYPTDVDGGGELLAPRTMGLLGRRYAKVLTMATAGVIGILVNTLSVNHYLQAVEAVRRRIADAGKKSYLVVVGKLNPVKLANFAEIEGWVVVGCWESSLVEDDAGFYQPVVTPFELEMALLRDDERIWGHKWWGGLEALVRGDGVADTETTETTETGATATEATDKIETTADAGESGAAGGVSDEEDTEAPQFDLRTGRLVTTSRPMRSRAAKLRKTAASADGHDGSTPAASAALALRPQAGELATIKGVVSPGAEFLRSQRTWQGLGTEFNDEDVEASTAVEDGRSGIARGYTVGGGNGADAGTRT